MSLKKPAIKPLLSINVFGCRDSGEANKVTFRRNTDWHSQQLLWQADILRDTIALLEDRLAKIDEEEAKCR